MKDDQYREFAAEAVLVLFSVGITVITVTAIIQLFFW